MKAITLIAFVLMSMWISAEAIAQVQGDDAQQDQKQVEGKDGKRARKGQSGARGQRGEGEAPGRRRGGPQMMEMIFSRFDADKNGSISTEEAPRRMKQRFDKLDANGDKSISREELQSAFANMRGGERGKGKGQLGRADKGKKGAKGQKGGKGQMGRGQMDFSKLLETADKNKDGAISLDEAPERMKRGFDRIDADSSGTISEEELKSAMSKMRQRGGAKGRNKADEGKNKAPQKPKRPPMDDQGESSQL